MGGLQKAGSIRSASQTTKSARVAQRIEHLTTDQKVGSSNLFARTRRNACSTSYFGDSYLVNHGLNSNRVSCAVSCASKNNLKIICRATCNQPWLMLIIVYQHDSPRVRLIFGASHQDLNLVKVNGDDETSLYDSRGLRITWNIKIIYVSSHSGKSNSFSKNWIASSCPRICLTQIYRLTNQEDTSSGLREALDGA